MKSVCCFETIPEYLGAKRMQQLLKELFPAMKTEIDKENDDLLRMYLTREEYVFVLNELTKLRNYSMSMPDAYEYTNNTLTSMPIEANIIDRYAVLYELMFDVKFKVIQVPDNFECNESDSIDSYYYGKKLSSKFNVDKDYQEYLTKKADVYQDF